MYRFYQKMFSRQIYFIIMHLQYYYLRELETAIFCLSQVKHKTIKCYRSVSILTNRLI